MKRVAIYARVSTSDKWQDLQTQILPLTQYALARERSIVETYTDTMSWSKESRPWYDQMMKDATRRKFDVVLVFRFDRASRSTKQLLSTLETLRVLWVDFVSYSEAIDTSTPAGQMMFTMISAFAQFERSIIQERVRAWMQRAKQQGKKIGRPKLEVDQEMIMKLSKQWYSVRSIAKDLWLSASKVYRTVSKPLKKQIS